MNFSLSTSTHTMTNGQLELLFNEHNVLQSINAKDVMLNLYEPTEFEIALSNIYLRIKEGKTISFTPLMYFNDNIRTFRTSDGKVGWETITDTFKAIVVLALATDTNTLFYTAEVTNLTSAPITYDLVFGQDLALADRGAVKSNECYVSQYLDHQIFDDENTGYVVCSRQNLPQSTGNPWAQIGSFSTVVGFSTDGYQFFGKDYRFDSTPSVLSQPQLENERLQFEMGYIALQTEDVELAAGHTNDSVFYLHFRADQPSSNVFEACDLNPIRASYPSVDNKAETEIDLPFFLFKADSTLEGEALSKDEIAEFFEGAHRFKEVKQGQLLSFFYSKNPSDSAM